MTLPYGLAAMLTRRYDRRFPRFGLMSEFARVKYARADCAAILRDRLRQHTEIARFLDPDSVSRGGIAATDELLYARANGWNFGLLRDTESAEQPTSGTLIDLPDSKARAAANLLRVIFGGTEREMLEGLRLTGLGQFSEYFLRPGGRRSRWPQPSGPGIYRREHASLTIESRRARLVFDPVCLANVVPFARTVMPDTDVDAVLITHSHGDHWHIPSIIAVAGAAETPVVVPHVPKDTLLCPDMPAELRAIGQHCLSPLWGAQLRFADIEVDVLPFYGEQPSVEVECPDPEVRNWGNCYRVNTPDFSALVLVDSGIDAVGSMLDAVANSVAARGPVDVVLACMRDFLTPFEIGGLSTYWMTLRFEDLERLYAAYDAGRLPSATAGLSTGGLAAICAAASARSFAPYAQGFTGVGLPIPAGHWGPSPRLSEEEALRVLEGQLEASGVPTSVQRWNPGDGLVADRAALRHQRASSALADREHRVLSQPNSPAWGGM